jgi:hypothetical protein
MYYTLCIRGILEQSCVVWHSRLTNGNLENLERVQKAAPKIILGNSKKADLDFLKDRRLELYKKICFEIYDK